MKIRVFRSLVLPVLLYSSETSTPTGELKWRLNSFGTMSLRRIPAYPWHDYVFNEVVHSQAGLKHVTWMVRERQLCLLYGHVARLSAEDPAHRIISCRDPSG